MQEDSIYVLSLGVENHPSQSVPATENVPYITNTSSNPTHINGELLFHCNELYFIHLYSSSYSSCSSSCGFSAMHISTNVGYIYATCQEAEE